MIAALKRLLSSKFTYNSTWILINNFLHRPLNWSSTIEIICVYVCAYVCVCVCVCVCGCGCVSGGEGEGEEAPLIFNSSEYVFLIFLCGFLQPKFIFSWFLTTCLPCNPSTHTRGRTDNDHTSSSPLSQHQLCPFLHATSGIVLWTSAADVQCPVGSPAQESRTCPLAGCTPLWNGWYSTMTGPVRIKIMNYDDLLPWGFCVAVTVYDPIHVLYLSD